MATLKEEIEAIKSLQDGIVNNKVANFAYTDEAYTENKADGVEIYDINKPQNIPVPDPDVLKVNPTVLTQGYRAQASSVTRMLVNHFFGRTSYNLNKVNDFFLSLLTKLSAYLGTANGIATLDSNARVPAKQLTNIIDDNTTDPITWLLRTYSISKIKSLFRATDTSIEELRTDTDTAFREVNKLIDDAQQAISDITDSKGQANGIASLDANAKVPVEQLQNIIDDYNSSRDKTISSKEFWTQHESALTSIGAIEASLTYDIKPVLDNIKSKHIYMNYIEINCKNADNNTSSIFLNLIAPSIINNYNDFYDYIYTNKLTVSASGEYATGYTARAPIHSLTYSYSGNIFINYIDNDNLSSRDTMSPTSILHFKCTAIQLF